MQGPRDKWFLSVIIVVSLRCSSLVLSLDLGSVNAPHPVVNSNGICGTFVWSRGYDCSEFKVPTKDGFLLSVQRISSREFGIGYKGPVFLYHGILQGGEAWVLNKPRESLAFVLADSGYDVWIGNTRTTMFTYGHTNYKRTQKEFWDWNWDDLVAYDVPTMLHFVNNMTAKPIYYVGYSQGAMTGFAAFTNNEIASLVKKAAMLSPVAYLGRIPSPLIRAAAFLFLDQVDLLLLHMYEFNPTSREGMQIMQTACKNTGYDCKKLLNSIAGPNCCINNSRTAYYDKYRQPTSTKNMAQLAQLLRSGRFGKYDYGFFGNLRRYWRISPPSYDLGAIPESLPFFLAHGGNDKLADPADVGHVARELPGSVNMLSKPNYGHEDFIFGTTSAVDVYPQLLEFLR